LDRLHENSVSPNHFDLDPRLHDPQCNKVEGGEEEDAHIQFKRHNTLYAITGKEKTICERECGMGWRGKSLGANQNRTTFQENGGRQPSRALYHRKACGNIEGKNRVKKDWTLQSQKVRRCTRIPIPRRDKKMIIKMKSKLEEAVKFIFYQPAIVRRVQKSGQQPFRLTLHSRPVHGTGSDRDTKLDCS
jgi:hypothetical protein